MIEMSIDIAKFDDVPGNWLCLDFTHTLQNRYNAQRHELLNSYRDLLTWGLYMRILTEEEAQQLLHIAEQYPHAASKALNNAVSLREAIYRIFYNIAEDSTAQQDDLAVLNTMLAQAMSRACIVSEKDSFSWDWCVDNDAERLQSIPWLVVRSAADLLTSDKLHD